MVSRVNPWLRGLLLQCQKMSSKEAAMSSRLYPASIAEAYDSEDDLDTPRLSSRVSLLFMIGVSALGYGLAYQAVSLTWRVFATG
jgi:hypothetical protein